MKENKQIMKIPLFNAKGEEGFMELNQEDREIYLFLRGGFGAK